MNVGFAVSLVAAALWVFAGLTAMNEAANTLRLAYVWFGLAMAVTVVVIGLPRNRGQG